MSRSRSRSRSSRSSRRISSRSRSSSSSSSQQLQQGGLPQADAGSRESGFTSSKVKLAPEKKRMRTQLRSVHRAHHMRRQQYSCSSEPTFGLVRGFLFFVFWCGARVGGFVHVVQGTPQACGQPKWASTAFLCRAGSSRCSATFSRRCSSSSHTCAVPFPALPVPQPTLILRRLAAG